MWRHDLGYPAGAKGACGAIGLGARDTLRLEAGSCRFTGTNWGSTPAGKEIPAYASMLSRFGVSLSPLKGEYIGRTALAKQFEALKRIVDRDYSLIADLPRIIQPIALIDKGVARAEAKVFCDDKHVGYVTSGTMVPLWQSQGRSVCSPGKVKTKADVPSGWRF